jgi:hypothetical protein
MTDGLRRHYPQILHEEAAILEKFDEHKAEFGKFLVLETLNKSIQFDLLLNWETIVNYNASFSEFIQTGWIATSLRAFFWKSSFR